MSNPQPLNVEPGLCFRSGPGEKLRELFDVYGVHGANRIAGPRPIAGFSRAKRSSPLIGENSLSNVTTTGPRTPIANELPRNLKFAGVGPGFSVVDRHGGGSITE